MFHIWNTVRENYFFLKTIWCILWLGVALNSATCPSTDHPLPVKGLAYCKNIQNSGQFTCFAKIIRTVLGWDAVNWTAVISSRFFERHWSGHPTAGQWQTSRTHINCINSERLLGLRVVSVIDYLTLLWNYNGIFTINWYLCLAVLPIIIRSLLTVVLWHW